ncbi:MAG: DinB family protein [Sulfitobacter sp.]
MITPAYVRTMARYNTWQNKQFMQLLDGVTQDELMLDRGAFFGSIMATLNHLLWADMLWFNRFDSDMPAPTCDGYEALSMHSSFGAWSAERFRTDGQIRLWADRLRSVDLRGDLSWRAVLLKQDFVRPVEDCVMQVFNHQTHHRGQVHMMMTAMGRKAPVSDLILMPEDA